MRESFTGSVSSTCAQMGTTLNLEISQYIDQDDVTLGICVSSIRMQKSKMMIGVKFSSQSSKTFFPFMRDLSTVSKLFQSG